MASKKKKILHTPWRPSFRNADSLPDTKVIRTGFLLNFFALSLAVGLLFLLAYKEYNSYSVKGALTTLEEQIQSNQSDNRKILQLSGRFKKSERVLSEIIEFTDQPVMVSELLKIIPDIRPESLVISSLSMRPVVIMQGRNSTIDYRIIISGTLSDQAEPSPTQVITDYQQQLAESDIIAPYFKDIALSRFIRDNVLNIFNFTIEVSLNAEPVEP